MACQRGTSGSDGGSGAVGARCELGAGVEGEQKQKRKGFPLQQVPELAKPSLPGLGQPPATLSSSICGLEFTFPFLANHPLPRFCKFKHVSARIGKTD